MTNFLTPVGRIVWGNPARAKEKTDNNGTPLLNKDGQPAMQWTFGLAIEKTHCNDLFAAMTAEAATLFPNGAPQNFSWKFKDGDGMDDKGLPFSNREGYAGCFVLAISTEAFPPRIVRLVNGSYQAVGENDIKCGDFVRVAVEFRAHAGKKDVRGSVPGLFVNPQIVEFIGYGEEIVSGPDAMSLLGGQAVALPPGASATPVAPTQQPGVPGQQPGVPGQQPGVPGQHPGVPGQHPGVPGQQPGVPVAPAHDFVQNAVNGKFPGHVIDDEISF